MARRNLGPTDLVNRGVIGDLVPAMKGPFDAAAVRRLKLVPRLKVGARVGNPTFTPPTSYEPTTDDLALHAALNAARKSAGKTELPFDRALGWLARCKTQMLGAAILPRPAGYQKAPPSPHSWALKAGNPWGVANTYECSQDANMQCSAYAAAKIIGYKNFAYEVQYHNSGAVDPTYVVSRWLDSKGHKAAVLSLTDANTGASFGPAYGMGCSFDAANQQYVANLGLAPVDPTLMPGGGGSSSGSSGSSSGGSGSSSGSSSSGSSPGGSQDEDDQDDEQPASTSPGAKGALAATSRYRARAEDKPYQDKPTEPVTIVAQPVSPWWLVGGLAGAGLIGYAWWRFGQR